MSFSNWPNANANTSCSSKQRLHPSRREERGNDTPSASVEWSVNTQRDMVINNWIEWLFETR